MAKGIREYPNGVRDGSISCGDRKAHPHAIQISDKFHLIKI